MKKKIMGVWVVLLVGIVGYAVYKFEITPQEKTHITLYGNVDIRDVVLGFRVSGRVQTLNVDEGDSVKQGDVLAILDKEPFIKEVNHQRAALDSATATLVNAQKEYLRQKMLRGQNANSQKDSDDAYTAFETATANVASAKALLDQAIISLQDTDLIAQEHGTILTRILEMGSIVAEGTPVYSLSLETPVWIRAYIEEPNLGHIYPGQKVTVSTDSGGAYEGQIGFISPQAEFTPKTVQTTDLRTSLVYRLRVIVDNPNTGLRQGMPVTVKVELDKK